MADDQQTIVSGEVICQLLMLSRQRIDQLVRDGWMTRHSPGKFALVETVQGYIRFLRDEHRRQNISAAASRISDARAKDIEVRTQQRLSRLVPLDAYEEMIDNIAGLVRAEFAGLPAACTRDLNVRRIIEREVNARLRRIAEHAMASAIRLEAIRGTDDAQRTDGAGPVGGGQQEVPGDGSGAGTA
jgi:hypothetical protein